MDLNAFLRPEIAAFAVAMEQRLRSPAAFESCLTTGNSWWKRACLRGLHDEMEKLTSCVWTAMHSYQVTRLENGSLWPLPKTDPEYNASAVNDVLRYAATAACCLMMITDVCGCLDAPRKIK